ncbi:MAG: hypothetical protein IJ312_07860 [Treponema sp.]|nr:hypothetical protein [Treponema sp.]
MKNLLVRIICGFTIGVTLLVLSYLGIYYIAGQETFDSVILKLTDVTILQHQIWLTGFAGSMMGFAFYVFEKAIEKDEKSPTSLILPNIVLMLAFVISGVLVKHIAVFDKVTSYMFLIIGTVLICSYMLFRAFLEAIDELILNKKIKERNG